MTDDNLDDTQQGSVGKQINIGKYYTNDEIKEIWNAAIEAAIKFMVTNRLEEGLYDKMRKELKK